MSLDPRVDILATLFHLLRSPDGESDDAEKISRIALGYCHAVKKLLESPKIVLDTPNLQFRMHTLLFEQF